MLVPSVQDVCGTWIKLRGLEIRENTVSDYNGVLTNHTDAVSGGKLATTVTND
jgi:hypothetical protein